MLIGGFSKSSSSSLLKVFTNKFIAQCFISRMIEKDILIVLLYGYTVFELLILFWNILV